MNSAGEPNGKPVELDVLRQRKIPHIHTAQCYQSPDQWVVLRGLQLMISSAAGCKKLFELLLLFLDYLGAVPRRFLYFVQSIAPSLGEHHRLPYLTPCWSGALEKDTNFKYLSWKCVDHHLKLSPIPIWSLIVMAMVDPIMHIAAPVSVPGQSRRTHGGRDKYRGRIPMSHESWFSFPIL